MKILFSAVLCLTILLGCADLEPGERVLLDETQLTQHHYASGYLTACVVDDVRYKNTCFTSKAALGKPPLDVLYQRFASARESMDRLDVKEANGAAFCTVGILLSCELDKLLRQRGYRRDSAVIYEIHSLMNGRMDSHLEKMIPKREFYPSNYDPLDREKFREVLLRSIDTLLKYDPSWRRW